MTRTRKFIVIASVLLVCIFAGLWSVGYLQVFTVMVWEKFTPITPPPRPANVPADAVWLGGRDGGEFARWRPVDSTCVRFDLWVDFSGLALVEDGLFCIDSGVIDYSLLDSLQWFYNGDWIELSGGRRLVLREWHWPAHVPSDAVWCPDGNDGTYIHCESTDSSCARCDIWSEWVAFEWHVGKQFCVDSGSIPGDSLGTLIEGFDGRAIRLKDGRELRLQVESSE